MPIDTCIWLRKGIADRKMRVLSGQIHCNILTQYGRCYKAQVIVSYAIRKAFLSSNSGGLCHLLSPH